MIPGNRTATIFFFQRGSNGSIQCDQIIFNINNFPIPKQVSLARLPSQPSAFAPKLVHVQIINPSLGTGSVYKDLVALYKAMPRWQSQVNGIYGHVFITDDDAILDI